MIRYIRSCLHLIQRVGILTLLVASGLLFLSVPQVQGQDCPTYPAQVTVDPGGVVPWEPHASEGWFSTASGHDEGTYEVSALGWPNWIGGSYNRSAAAYATDGRQAMVEVATALSGGNCGPYGSAPMQTSASAWIYNLPFKILDHNGNEPYSLPDPFVPVVVQYSMSANVTRSPAGTASAGGSILVKKHSLGYANYGCYSGTIAQAQVAWQPPDPPSFTDGGTNKMVVTSTGAAGVITFTPKHRVYWEPYYNDWVYAPDYGITITLGAGGGSYQTVCDENGNGTHSEAEVIVDPYVYIDPSYPYKDLIQIVTLRDPRDPNSGWVPHTRGRPLRTFTSKYGAYIMVGGYRASIGPYVVETDTGGGVGGMSFNYRTRNKVIFMEIDSVVDILSIPPDPSRGTMIMSGSASVNYKPGYTYVVTVKDKGSPGTGLDEFGIVIKDPSGNTILDVPSTKLSGGDLEIQ
jgi:hypothetical protein